MPLLYKINTTSIDYPVVTFDYSVVTIDAVSFLYDDLFCYIYENLDVIKNHFQITSFMLIFTTVVYFLMYIIYSLVNFVNEKKNLRKRNEKLENENKKLQLKILDLKKMNKQYRNLYKHYKDENEKLKEPNYHRENGVRKSLRVKKNEIIEEITDDEKETYNLIDSIKEIYKLYPGTKFDDKKMYKYIKKHPKLKNSRSKTPVRTMNHYLQKLRHKRFLKRELVEGKYYYSE